MTQVSELSTNPYLVADLLQTTRTAANLDEYGDKPPVDLNALQVVMLRVSEMVCELPWIREMEISPLIVDENGAVAVDARITVQEPPLLTRKYDHMAIHPYPSNLITHFQLPDGETVTVRPIRPEDAELQQTFVKSLSAESRYFRFMSSVHELSTAQLARLTQIDYDREMALTLEMGTFGARSPKTFLIARVSMRSFSLVPVPCAEM